MSRLRMLLVAGAAALASVRAVPPPRGMKVSHEGWVKVAGHVRDAATGAPVAYAQVVLRGPALMAPGVGRFENGEIDRHSDAQGAYRLLVPPGIYECSVQAENYRMVDGSIRLLSGLAVTHDVNLTRKPAPRMYRVDTLTLPRRMIPEIAGLAFTPRGSLVAATRRGEVWIRDAASGRWRRFAEGLQECFGIVAVSERQMYVAQRAEVTRLSDSTGGGKADRFETVGDDWGLTGNYHELNYGLMRDRHGNLFGVIGMASKDGDGFKDVLSRGTLDPRYFGPGLEPTEEQRSVVRHQGWAYELTPAGEFIPYASGFREAIGVGLSPRDELFVTDVAGAWVPTSVLLHVQQGAFYGHPDGLKWNPAYAGHPPSREQLRQMRVPPVVYIPHGVLGTAAGQPVWDTTGGKFGPFGGQIFIGDVNGQVMRVDLEKVAGEYQGAVFPFLTNTLHIGPMRAAFGPDGALYFGETTRGWMPTGSQGIQRIAWSGEMPVDILSMHLTPDGFALAFTAPMGEAALADAKHYRVRRFQYNYDEDDGSLRMNSADVPVTGVRARPDGLGVDLKLLELQPDFIYELDVADVRSRSGAPIANPIGFYTANRLLAGSAPVGASKIAATPAELGPPDPELGQATFRQMCMVCHQPDGRGSKIVGTPDFTAPTSPLIAKPHEALVHQVVFGSKIMPAFGHQLTPRDIENVLAYLQRTFAPNHP